MFGLSHHSHSLAPFKLRFVRPAHLVLLVILAAFTFVIPSAKGDERVIHIVSDATVKYSERLEPGYEQVDFDDSAWFTVAAPSWGLCLDPSPQIPDSNAIPVWSRTPEEFQTIYARKTFVVSNPVRAVLRTLVDDDFDVYINGVLVRSDWDYWEDGVHEDDISSLLTNGLNVLAMKASDTVGGCQHLDFDIAITVASQEPRDQILEVRNNVEQLEMSGTLNKGQAKALTTKLDRALAKLDRGDKKAAANQLHAFVNQVEAFHTARKLTKDQAQSLKEQASAVIDQLRQ